MGMSQSTPKRPLITLQKAVNKRVAVKLKNEIEYRGKMTNIDSYMNLILLDVGEYNGEKLLNSYRKVVIRGNNILLVRIMDEL